MRFPQGLIYNNRLLEFSGIPGRYVNYLYIPHLEMLGFVSHPNLRAMTSCLGSVWPAISV